MTARVSFDAIVIGGGPAGSTAATVIAQDGWRVLLLERDYLPRYRIGESLLPATIHGVCKTIGVASKIEAAGFVKKLGGSWRWGRNPDVWEFRFDEQLAVRDASYAFQVERSIFDKILLDHSSACGAEVREGSSVNRVARESDGTCTVEYEDSSGHSRVVEARFVVDASGASKVSGLGQRSYDKFFRNIAIYGYFAGGGRLPGSSAGNIFSAAFSRGWGWYIPLRSDLTSVGFVVRVDEARMLKGEPARAYRHLLEECAPFYALIGDAPLSKEPMYDEIRIVRDYSYNNDTFYRDGCALVGDAACFIDPVFSSGVHLATYSGLCAARSVNSVLCGALEETPAFDEFTRRYRREFAVFYKFLLSFYDMHVDRESCFWNAQKILNLPTSNREAFVRLVAGLSGMNDERIEEKFVATAKESSELLGVVSTIGAGWKAQQPELFTRAEPLIQDLFAARAELLGERTMLDMLRPSSSSRRWEASEAESVRSDDHPGTPMR